MKIEEKNKTTRLKVYLSVKNISQKDLAERTYLSPNTINKLVNEGTATNSVIKLVGYELGISYNDMLWYLQEVDSFEHKHPAEAPPSRK